MLLSWSLLVTRLEHPHTAEDGALTIGAVLPPLSYAAPCLITIGPGLLVFNDVGRYAALALLIFPDFTLFDFVQVDCYWEFLTLYELI